MLENNHLHFNQNKGTYMQTRETLLEVVELVSMQDKLVITDIQDTLNEVFDLKDSEQFKIGGSSSRDSKDGSLMDLRSGFWEEEDSAFKNIRIIFISLQENLILKFEEKIKHYRNEVQFVITHINPSKFWQAIDSSGGSPRFTNVIPHDEEQINKTTIRTAGHNLNVSYQSEFIFKNKFIFRDDTQLENKARRVMEFSSEGSNFSATQTMNMPEMLNKICQGASKSVMDLVAEYPKEVIDEIIKMLNQSCGISDTQAGFSLYYNSSDVLYPLDFRLIRKSNDDVQVDIKSILSGYSQKGVIFKCKDTLANDSQIYILKSICLWDIRRRIELSKTQVNKADLESAVQMLQNAFPNDLVAKDLQIVDGFRSSATVPFLHIRTSKDYWIEKEYAPLDYVLSLLKLGKILDYDRRCRNVLLNDLTNPQYAEDFPLHKVVGEQLIIKNINLPKLKNYLVVHGYLFNDMPHNPAATMVTRQPSAPTNFLFGSKQEIKSRKQQDSYTQNPGVDNSDNPPKPVVPVFGPRSEASSSGKPALVPVFGPRSDVNNSGNTATPVGPLFGVRPGVGNKTPHPMDTSVIGNTFHFGAK